MVNIVIEDVTGFLKMVPPFQFVDDKEIEDIASSVTMEFYPKDTVLIQQGGEPSRHLRVIKKGGAKVFIRSDEGVDALTDYRGEGDLIGYLSLLSGDRARATVVTVEDTICFLIPRENIQRLIESNANVRDFFNRTFISKYLDKPVSELHDKGLMNIGSDKLLFTTTVGELATKGVISAFNDITIKEAAEIMSRHRISSLVLIDSNAVPVGIVTDTDLRDKVVAKGRDVNENIKSVMSLSLIKAEAREYCFEALLKMIRYNIHHLLVVDDGKLKGIITNHDLMLLQGISPINIARDIESQFTIEGLIPVSNKTNTIIALLLKEGVRASSIARIITELNDRLVKKIIEIAEKRLGRPPVQYCWIVFGSEGRKEQTFKTDQDNAIILDDYDSSIREESVKNYFSSFAELVREGLVRCGFPLCPAGYMASNPAWRQPLSVWRGYFKDWITNPTPDSLLKSLIFFDFRPLCGEMNLAYNLKECMVKSIDGNKLFLGNIANTLMKNSPPIGFLKNFVVEKSGEHKDKLNLKIKGTALIVDMVRLFAFERGVKESSTIERIDALRDKHTIVKDVADEIIHAFDLFMLLRIENQMSQIQQGLKPQNYVNPNQLSPLQIKMMKDAYSLVTKLQGLIMERYKSMIW